MLFFLCGYFHYSTVFPFPVSPTVFTLSTIFTASIERRLQIFFVPTEHILRKVDARVDFNDVARLCEQHTPSHAGGSPPIEPIVVFKLYLVMFLFNIPSERQLCIRAHSDLAIRWFCGFGLFGKVPHHCIFTRTRQRFGLTGFEEIFRYIVRECMRSGLVRNQMALFDSSALQAHAEAYTPAEQARRLTKEFLEKLYGTAAVEGERPSDQEQLEQMAQAAANLVGYKDAEPSRILENVAKAEASQKQEAKPVLERSEGTEPGDQGENQLQTVKGPGLDEKELKNELKGLLGAMDHTKGDPDARMGRTSRKETFCGYLGGYAMDAEHQVFTACVLDPGDTHSSTQLEAVYEQHKENTSSKDSPEGKPEKAALDAGYDDKDSRAIFAEDQVQAYIRLSHRENKHGVLPTDMFRFDESGRLHCPKGYFLRRLPRKRESRGKAMYVGTMCPECSLKPECTKQEYRTV